MKPIMPLEEISIFSVNNVTVGQTYQNYEQSRQKLGRFLEYEVPQKSKFLKKTVNKSWLPSPIFFTEMFFWKDSTNFQHLEMTLKIRILRCLRRLFIILESLTVILFSDLFPIDAYVVSCLT